MASTTEGVNTSTQDLVAILEDGSLTQVFAAANPMRVGVREAAKLTQFPVEDGTTRSDHLVRLPIEITVDFLLTDDTRNAFAELRAAFQQRTLLAIQTKVAVYFSMLITSIPHDETPDNGDSITVPITLQEWITVEPEYGALPPTKVANKAQSSTVTRGQQQTTATPAAKQEPVKKQSLLYKALF